MTDGTDHDSSVGSVFFPLRPCNKRKAIDEVHVVEDDDDDVVDTSKKVKPFNKDTRTTGDGELFLFVSIVLMSAKYVVYEMLSYVAENAESGKAFSTFKVLSYNVWFREDLELQKRMKAIGDLVQLHSPDFICFQVSIFVP